MEYSVKDLVKILLKKWYLILIIVGIAVGASYFLSDRSYQQATQDYQTYTTALQPVQAKTGTLTAAYSIRAKTESTGFIQAYTNFLVHHNMSSSESSPTIEEIAVYAVEALEPHMESLFLNKDILESADISAASISYTNQTNITTPGTASPPPVKPIEVRYIGEGRFYITLTSITEASGQQILQNYIKELTQTLSSPTLEYQVDKISYVFNADKPLLSDSAHLSQLVMIDPSTQDNAQTRTQTTVVIKRLCVTAVFSFAIACLLILLVTFVKDVAASDKQKESNSEDSAPKDHIQET